MALRPRRGMFELPEDVVPTAVKPAPTTKQTAPVGIPSSDPVKTQPGETGPFDPNAQAPVPAPAPSGMGINIDLDIPDIPSDIVETVSEEMFGQYGDRLFPYVYTARNDDLNTGQSRGPLDGLSIEMVSAQDLYARFAQDNYAQRAFGSFENYIGYLNDLLDLAEEHPEINWWKDKGFRNLTGSNQQVAEFYGLEDEDARMGSGARIDAESANLADANEAFEAMLALPEFRQLVADRGIETQFRLGENDIYVFNGLTATEIHEGADTFGSYFEAAMDLANRLTLAYMTGQVGDAGLSSLRDAAELGTLGPYSSSIGRVIDLMNSGQAGAGIEAASVLNEVGPLIVNLGDDTQVEDPLAEAEEEPAEEGGAFDPLLTGDPGDLFEPETPIEETPFEFEIIEPEEQEEPEPDLPIEIEPPTLPEEDILADTTQEATGLEITSVIEDLFSDYMEEFRTDFEGQQNITIDQVQEVVANALGSIEQPETLTQEQVQQIVNDAVASIPQADTLSEQQVQDIVNNAVSSIEIPEGITTEEVQDIVNEAVSGIPAGTSPEQVQDIVNEAISGIVIPEGMTPEQVQQIVDTAVSGIQFPEGISTEDVDQIVSEAIRNIEFPEVDALSVEEVQDIVDTAVAGIDIPEGISEEQVGNIVDTAIANIEFPEGVTQEQVNQIVNQAIGDIEFPEGVTQDQVTQIVNTAIAGIEFPEIDTLSTEEVEGIVNTAISGIEFPEGVTADQVLNIVQEQLAAQPEDLTADEVNNIVSAAINSIEFPASVTQEEVVDLLSDVQDTLTSDFETYQEGVREELEVAEEERAVLGGQLGTLTEEVANIATDLINVGGDIEDLDQRTQDRLDELGLDLEGIGLLVNVNFEALQEGMLTQESALRELVEETTRQTEQSLTDRLEEAEQGFATSLSDTEASLLSEITGVEAGVLQQLAEVEGGLQSQFGEQFGQVQQQVAGLGEQVTGLGEQVAGVGEGIGQLGQALGAGLLGLAAAQPTAQEIAAAMPRQPVEFDPFLKGLSPFQPLTPLSLSPIQEKDATSELNKFIGRQTGMLV